MGYKKLDIKKPCTQNWDEMKPMGTGRHCSSCNHIIHDFSNMNDSELLDMLQSGKYSCGMFEKNQMGILYYVQEEKQQRKKYWAAIAAAIVAGVLQVSTGYSQTPNSNQRLMPRSQSILRVDDPSTITQEKKTEETPKTEEPAVEGKSIFNFQVLDGETKKPLQNVKVEILGQSYYTDAQGTIAVELPYTPGGYNSSLHIEFSLTEYENGKVKVAMSTVYGYMNVLYLRPKKEEKLMILGQWG